MPISTVTTRITRPGLERDITLLLDQDLYSQAHMFREINTMGMYERETVRMLDILLQPGDSFIDIGGHIGFFSLLAAGLVGPRGRVMTFEPEMRNYQHLLRHIEVNKLENIMPFPWAVSDVQRVTSFYENLDNDGGHAFWDPGLHPFNQKSRQSVTTRLVFTIRLDDFFRGAPRGFVKLIKIDVEGSEVNILRGAREFLRSTGTPAVIAEVNFFALAQMGTEERDMRTIMHELGYSAWLLHGEKPMRMEPEQHVQQKDRVYNLLFANVELDNALRQRLGG